MSVVGPPRLSTGEADTRITSLIIRAIEIAPQRSQTVAELYKRLVELNPNLAERDTDWKSSVRHTLSTSTMFVRIPGTSPGQWTHNPLGERSTHKNRRSKENIKRPARSSATATTVKKKKRLGTTLRRGGKKATWPKAPSTIPSIPQQDSRWDSIISSLTTQGKLNNHQPYYPNIPALCAPRRNSDVFMDEAIPQANKQRPSQFVDTTKGDPFHPCPN